MSSKYSKLSDSKIVLKLSEDEANDLAEELKKVLRSGQTPKSDEKNIQLMVAGLGDKRGLVRRTFAESLGVIGKAAVPALLKALKHESNVTLRRAAAKTLKLVGEPKVDRSWTTVQILLNGLNYLPLDYVGYDSSPRTLIRD